jgi:hypothetical protein
MIASTCKSLDPRGSKDWHLTVPSLNEVKYLSFPSLFKLQDEFRRTGRYNLYNPITKSRESLELDRLLVNILSGPLLDIIRQPL